MSPESEVPAIRVSGLVVRYGRREALAGLDLVVPPARIFGVMGPNGAGKTTLFRVVATLQAPTEGSVHVAGHDVQASSGRVRRSIGVVFQGASADPLLTAQENLACAAHLYGLRGAALRERSQECLRLVGLFERRTERVARYSGGMRRRLEVARALLHRPPLLLMDEPSAGLDPGTRAELWGHLASLRSVGVTIFLATHDLDEAERCDRLAILDQGRHVMEGSPAELRAGIGEEIIVVECDDAPALARDAHERFGLPASAVADQVRIEVRQAHDWVRRLYEAWSGRVRALTVRPPSLEDVFVRRTGHPLFAAEKDTDGGAR